MKKLIITNICQLLHVFRVKNKIFKKCYQLIQLLFQFQIIKVVREGVFSW